jgi:hypothetical protein
MAADPVLLHVAGVGPAPGHRADLEAAVQHGVEAVVWAADGAAATALAAGLRDLPDDVAGTAARAPVVDALKWVDGDRVVEAVDRSTVHRLVAPAALRVGHAGRVLPLRDTGGQESACVSSPASSG